MEGLPERFGVECQGCGETIEIDDSSTILFLDEQNQLWAYIKCPLPYDCDAMTLEVDAEDVAYFSHLTTYYNQDGDPVPNIGLRVEEAIDVITKQEKEAAARELAEKLLLTNWGLFWSVYDPQPHEFLKKGGRDG